MSMKTRAWSAGVAVLLAVAGAACGDDDDSVVDQARDTATSAQQRAEAATRLTATLTGAAEVPPTGDPDGSGTATVNLDATGGKVCYEVSVRNIDTPSGMHIHEGETGKSGSIVVALTTPTATGITNTCTDADRALIGRIVANPGGFYLNVHTAAHPQGAVRGQLTQ
jgi:hypothetical protein